MFTYQSSDQRITVRLEQLADGTFRATVGERVYTFSAEAVEQGWALAFSPDGERLTVRVADDGESRSVHLRGDVYTFTRETKRRNQRSSASSGGGGVTAQMPGQVRELLVAEGDTVTRGQALLILEAMKMELRAVAPADGVVKRLLAGVGDVVSRGQVLVEIE